MNATNPFQIPSCFVIDHERRRRERFKRTFIAVVATGVLLMVGLLIEGCMSQHAQAANTPAATTDLQPSTTLPASMTAPKPVVLPPPPAQPAALQPKTHVSKADTATPGHPQTIYVVKTGDNLTRIAKTHGTTVKAIEAANGLASDHISVGMKLKLPEA